MFLPLFPGPSFFQYQWRSDIKIDAEIDVVDGSELELPKGSLQGGQTYRITSSVLIEGPLGLVKSEATISLEVEMKGVKAVVTPAQVTIGLNRPIKLSARSSVDLDNTDRNFDYDWYCLTDLGGGCAVLTNNDGGPLQALEKALDKKALRGPELVLPERLLPPGSYIFTLVASKGQQRSEANASVTIVPDDLPSIEILLAETSVLPFKKFVATGIPFFKRDQKLKHKLQVSFSSLLSFNKWGSWNLCLVGIRKRGRLCNF